MIKFHRALVAMLAAPLALGLAACGSSEGEGGATAGESIAPIAAPAGTAWVDVVEVTPEDGYRIGNPDAPIKLVEYASHTCPHCAAFAEESAALKDKYVASGVVSYELRNQIHDPVDLMVALLARCGAKESFLPLAEQFWANLIPVMQAAQANQAALAQAQTLPTNQRFQRMAEAAGLIDFFAARGIAREQAMQCLADGAKAEAIAERSDQQSQELDVSGTPTFFINGNKLDNVGSWDKLEPALQNAGAR